MLTELSVKEFLSKTASDSPAPGGGSVSALCAAAGCALVQMVAGLTVGKKGCEAAWPEMEAMTAEMERRRETLLRAVDEDAEAFDRVMAAFGLPKASEEEKKARSAAIQAATREAALVPYRLAEAACGLLEFCQAAAERGNPNTASDAAVAAMLCRTAALGALYNVRINLSSLKDEAFKAEYAQKADALEKAAVAGEQKVLAAVRV